MSQVGLSLEANSPRSVTDITAPVLEDPAFPTVPLVSVDVSGLAVDTLLGILTELILCDGLEIGVFGWQDCLMNIGVIHQTVQTFLDRLKEPG